GLFDQDAKRALPSHPRRIGVITSSAGAALHDVLTALARRAPHVQVIIYPSPVQGADAPPSLVQAPRTSSSTSPSARSVAVRRACTREGGASA
ncbi:exodeoxyribonuclease VII large subunit, partial [Escherichia coli]|uniref:exodeoxyribonuclease VII large subunit n=1 Tax=Escherichia coli TaxID=562 RepID=UPI0013D3026E